MDGNGNGKLNGKQLFVCRRNFAFFCPIECVIPEKDFLGDNPKNNTGQRTSGEFKIQDHMIHDMIAGTLVNTSGKVYIYSLVFLASKGCFTSVFTPTCESQGVPITTWHSGRFGILCIFDAVVVFLVVSSRDNAV